MRLFNKELTITTVKPISTQARFARKSGNKVGMDCAKKAPSHSLFSLLAGAK